MAHQLEIKTYHGKFAVPSKEGAALVYLSKVIFKKSVSNIVGELVVKFISENSLIVDWNVAKDIEDTIVVRNMKIRKRYDMLTRQGFYRKGKGKKCKDTHMV